jgi:HEPN domain-containing protein
LTAVHIVLGAAVLVLSLAAGLWGGWAWYRGEPAPGFWTLLRVSQAALALQVAVGALLLVLGHEPARLHLLYGLLPLAVSFVAEQLRLVAADQVLQRHDMDSAREMERLGDEQQRAIVLEIVRRETGVMAASALVVFVLALRAAGVAGFLG